MKYNSKAYLIFTSPLTLAIAFILTSIIILAFSCFQMIEPGYVGVVVNKLGDKKGVDDKELHVGLHWIGPWKSVYQFPIFEQNIMWYGKGDNDYAFSFHTAEGMAVFADLGLTYHLIPEHIPKIFQKYRRGMDEITHVFIRNYIRDAIIKAGSNCTIEELYSGKATFIQDIENSMRKDFSPIGIELSRIYLIGRFHFPDNVIKALNSKIEAMQRAQQRENELRESEAEAKKQIAKAEGQARCVVLQAEAEAQANLVLSSSITPTLIEWQSVQKWDGKLPQSTSGAIPFITMKQ